MLKTLLGAGALTVALLGAGANTAFADTTINPTAPTFLDTCGSAHDTYLIPNSPHVSYWVGGVKLNPGVRAIDPASNTVSIYPVADSGYQLSQQNPWSYTFNTGQGESDTGCAASPSSTAAASPSSTSKASAPASSSSTAAPSSTSATPSSTTQTVGPTAGPTQQTATTMPKTGINSFDMLAGAGVVGLAGFTALGASARLGKKN